MPSGGRVHPYRLILRDGSLMWKHAFYNNGRFTSLPATHAHEAHIVKTAQRLEELNIWVSQELDPWCCLMPLAWYDQAIPLLSQGISVFFNHALLPADHVYDVLKDHIQDHEELELTAFDGISPVLYFKRC